MIGLVRVSEHSGGQKFDMSGNDLVVLRSISGQFALTLSDYVPQNHLELTVGYSTQLSRIKRMHFS
jgi:hypothetical protein